MASKSSGKPALKLGLTAEELDAQYNPDTVARRKIDAALAQLEDRALPHEQFRKLTGLANAQLATYTEPYADYHIPVRVNGRPAILWAGTKAFARRMREKLGV